jgi:hypothetical protein
VRYFGLADHVKRQCVRHPPRSYGRSGDEAHARADNNIGNSLHRGNVFRVRMSDEAANPRIIEILATLKKSDLVGTPTIVTK